MNTEAFCRQSRVLIAIGKGGVGKTTVSAALAKVAARAGLSVLIVALDDAGALHRHFASAATVVEDADPNCVLQSGRHRVKSAARSSMPTMRSNEYLAEGANSEESPGTKVADESASLKVIATTSPGLRELLLLSKIVQLEKSKSPTSSSWTPRPPDTPCRFSRRRREWPSGTRWSDSQRSRPDRGVLR